MNILWINHRDPKHPYAGGAEVRIHEIGKRLVQKGHSVKLVCERWRGSEREDHLDGIDIVRVANKQTIHFRVPLILNNFDCDVVIDDIAHAIPWESEFFTSKPVIAQIHHVHQNVLGFELNPLAAKVAAFLERTIRYYSAFVAVSDSTRQALMKMGIPDEKIKVIPNGIDIDLYRPLPKSSVPTVLWVGRVKRYKRVDHILRAFTLIQRRYPGARLMIVGSGDYIERIKHLAAELGLENVVFTGYVSDEEKVELMGSSWVNLTTSFVEGWGMTVTESAACGTPAIAYNVPGLRDSIHNNSTGFLVDDGNVDALAEATLKVLGDEKLRVNLGTHALECSKDYTWDRVAQDFLDYIKLVNGR